MQGLDVAHSLYNLSVLPCMHESKIKNMKNIYCKYFQRIAAFSFVVFILSSCEPNVVFRQALPPQVDEINRIPDRFHGVFMCESDSSRIYVEDYLVLRESYFTFVIHVDRVRETEDCKITDGGLMLPGRKACVPFEYIDDEMIKADVYSIDTLFNFRKNEVMKMYKGRMFMNYENNLREFVTFMITPEIDGSMTWEIVNVPDKINHVEQITHEYTTRENRDQETIYVINPTLVEFERILEYDYLTECDILYPLHKAL